ncbi:MAG: hypothetical protein GWN99_13290 [Gemmatimonadetes bacterium]|uniref:Uncharacterized protein n=1 Tax=Candidatus Kutchimonas denitrificans TaxID=3056748 RepID=A0AAE5CDI6_9BACT|nr:hypothetical protein [Gemmatimonadota bacterium]NIR75854.1 hypothetical protein [Candidatus Kutchimonas denitrificans]NIS02021.1 hypothetical protein [Gemmatimonadota bacterium]NIT67825.1 hypothetical protein [Gemmatimonadota bacterium]NIU53812.1 hypothetical protein [Gemmatimonadota bacterium]
MKYPGDPAKPRAASRPFVDDNPHVEDVVDQFARVRPRGDYLAARDGGVFPRHRYTYKNHGDNRARVHFQGIGRLRDGKHVVLSGGDIVAPASQLFVIRMDSRRTGAWGSNILFDDDAPESDGLVAIARLDEKLWHSGGISVLGDIVAVPIEDEKSGRSRIVFLDLSEPEKPRSFETTIERTKRVGMASAATLCKLPNGHYICAVWKNAPLRLDFYLSRSTDFADGFRKQHLEWPFGKLLPTGGREADYQGIHFVRQADGKFFLVGTENTSKMAPLAKGDDVADLLLVEFVEETLGDNPKLAEPAITRVAEKRFEPAQEYSNMDAAGGAFVTADLTLCIYSGFHWRRSKELRFVEFRPDKSRARAPIDSIDEAWVDLYEHKAFHGRRLSVLGRQDEVIRNYKKIRVEGKGFGDKVSSLRYQIPVGHTYRLFRDPDFKASKRQPSHMDLEGTGRVEEIDDLEAAENFDEEVSSSRYL